MTHKNGNAPMQIVVEVEDTRDKLQTVEAIRKGIQHALRDMTGFELEVDIAFYSHRGDTRPWQAAADELDYIHGEGDLYDWYRSRANRDGGYICIYRELPEKKAT